VIAGLVILTSDSGGIDIPDVSRETIEEQIQALEETIQDNVQ
jgi:hypothetical protein